MGIRGEVVDTSIWLLELLIPIAHWGLLLLFVVIIPLGLFDKTKRYSGLAMVFMSYFFGTTLWVWCVGLSFGLAGWFWLIVGLVLFGAGVIIVAFFAALFAGMWSACLAIVVSLVIVWGCRLMGSNLIYRAETEGLSSSI